MHNKLIIGYCYGHATMLASGGYEWTVIPVDRHKDYMAALEQASAKMNINPFAEFIHEFVSSELNNKPDKSSPHSP